MNHPRNFSISAIAVLSLSATGCLPAAASLTQLEEERPPPPPELVTLKMTGYSPRAGRIFKDFFVANYSVKIHRGVLQAVSSRDSLSDSFKNSHVEDYGFAPTGENSANPFFSDLLLYLTGIVTSQQTLLYCAPGFRDSSSHDALSYVDARPSPSVTQFLGLRDCEKNYIGLSPTQFDFDGDGIPDYLELRCGMNPKNGNDGHLNPTADGVSNLEKCKRGIPLDENANSTANTLYGSKYKIDVKNDGSRDFTVSNISVLNAGIDNFVAFYLTESDTAGTHSYLSTAYTILGAGATTQVLTFPYWAKADGSTDTNQEVVFP